ncbi:MAG: 5-(carboxyamino)imidazole ribonucleotide synthase [Bacteroidales bacterium]|nr:5-(carboxyamino)imidazole ribonucleotide synthase [Bacteroidales bacterium]
MEKKIETIGIIGGGQLGMMMTEAAHCLGYKVIVLDPSPVCSAGQISEHLIVAPYHDEEAIEALCRGADVVTYEFENVPYTSVKRWKQKYHIPQGEMPLYLSQHRVREKDAARAAGARTGAYKYIVGENREKALREAIEKMNYPAVLKTCTGGYDGKGQVVLHGEQQWEKALSLVKSAECILEKYIPFDIEISVIVTRGLHGDMTTFPVTFNIHKDNILFMSIAPAPLPSDVCTKAENMALALMQHFDFVGTLAIEMFVVGDEVLFNEMAPRPHNSGHYTIEGCETSQFAQHVRAITGMPLGSTRLKQPTIMVNYLGQHVKGVATLAKKHLPGVFVHDYHKTMAIHNRKMGHVTFVDYPMEEVEKIVRTYW